VPLDSARASVLGRIGQANRWAKYVTPEDRAAQTAAARAKQFEALIAKAKAMPGGDTLTPEELIERATRLRNAAMHQMALRRMEKRRERLAQTA
jgi:hypothetical protein